MKSALIFFLSSSILLPFTARCHSVTFGHESHGHQTIHWNGSYSTQGKDFVFSASSCLKDKKVPYQSFSLGARTPFTERFSFGTHAFFDTKRFKPEIFGTAFEAISPWAGISLAGYLPLKEKLKPTVEMIGNFPVHNSNNFNLGARYSKTTGIVGVFGLSATPLTSTFGDLKASVSGSFGRTVKLHKTLSAGISFEMPIGKKVKPLCRMRSFEMRRLERPRVQTDKKPPKEAPSAIIHEDGYSTSAKALFGGVVSTVAFFAKWYLSHKTFGYDYPASPPPSAPPSPTNHVEVSQR